MTESGGGYELNRKDALNRKYAVGTKLATGTFGVKGKWKYSVQGGAANSTVVLQDGEGLPVKFPTNSLITDCIIEPVVKPTSSTGSGSLAFSVSNTGDLKAAAFVAAYTVSAPLACTVIRTTLSSMLIRPASEATLTMGIGSEALTGGEVNVHVGYVLGG